jgi:hypothetical protein
VKDQSQTLIRSPLIWLSDDNIELFQHDESRLLVIVRHMFHEVHHPFGETHYRNHEPVKHYNALYNHVFSKRAKDLDRNQTELQNFKPNTALSFVNDYRRWCDIFDEIRMIQNSAIPQATLQAFLDKHYTYDPRPAISGALSHARNSKWTFDETISAIIVLIPLIRTHNATHNPNARHYLHENPSQLFAHHNTYMKTRVNYSHIALVTSQLFAHHSR